MRSDSVKNMSAYADQNHAPSLAAARLEIDEKRNHALSYLRLKSGQDRAWFLFFDHLKSTDLEIFIFNEQHRLLGNPLITQKNLNTNFICSQRTENQKFNKTENVMSERVKMPSRHFLRCDYLHIFCFIKFLVFVSLAS